MTPSHRMNIEREIIGYKFGLSETVSQGHNLLIQDNSPHPNPLQRRGRKTDKNSPKAVP